MIEPRSTLIVGVDGLVGRHLFALYRLLGLEPRGTTRRPGRVADDVAFFDLTQPDVASLPLSGVRTVLLPAAASKVDACQIDPIGTRQVNVVGITRLLEQSWDRALRPVVFSSDYVFPGTDRAGYGDDAPRGPTTEYGRQKAEVETFLETSGRPYLLVRLSKTFGLERGDGTLLDEMAARFVAGQSFAAAYDQVFNPTFAGDVAQVVLELQAREAAGAWNLCAPEPWSRFDLACALACRMKLPIERVRRISLDELPVARPKCTRLLPNRLMRDINWSFPPLDQALARIARAYGVS